MYFFTFIENFEVPYLGLVFMLYSPMGGNFFDSSMSYNKLGIYYFFDNPMIFQKNCLFMYLEYLFLNYI